MVQVPHADQKSRPRGFPLGLQFVVSGLEAGALEACSVRKVI